MNTELYERAMDLLEKIGRTLDPAQTEVNCWKALLLAREMRLEQSNTLYETDPGRSLPHDKSAQVTVRPRV